MSATGTLTIISNEHASPRAISLTATLATWYPTVDNTVYAISPSGSDVYIAGLFDNAGGSARNKAAGINGAADAIAAYDPAIVGSAQGYQTAVDSQGRIYVAGAAWTSMGGSVAHNYLARWSSAGVFDSAYNPTFNGTIEALAIDSSDRVLVGGSFTTVNGAGRNRLVRLTTAGATDATFSATSGSRVTDIKVQPDGKVIVVSLSGGIVRYTSTGSADGSSPTASAQIKKCAIQSDGKIVFVGQFVTVDTLYTLPGVARLNANFTLDTGYTPSTTGTPNVENVAIDESDNAIVVGSFTTLGGSSRNRCAMISSAGVVSATFNPNLGGTAYVVAVDDDGYILLGGAFTTVGGVTRNYIARLTASGTLA